MVVDGPPDDDFPAINTAAALELAVVQRSIVLRELNGLRDERIAFFMAHLVQVIPVLDCELASTGITPVDGYDVVQEVGTHMVYNTPADQLEGQVPPGVAKQALLDNARRRMDRAGQAGEQAILPTAIIDTVLQGVLAPRGELVPLRADVGGTQHVQTVANAGAGTSAAFLKLLIHRRNPNVVAPPPAIAPAGGVPQWAMSAPGGDVRGANIGVVAGDSYGVGPMGYILLCKYILFVV